MEQIIYSPVIAFSTSSKMLRKKMVSMRTMNIDNMDKFIIGGWVMKVLHADTLFLMVSF